MLFDGSALSALSSVLASFKGVKAPGEISHRPAREEMAGFSAREPG
jgi:hypothetical protein